MNNTAVATAPSPALTLRAPPSHRPTPHGSASADLPSPDRSTTDRALRRRRSKTATAALFRGA